MCSAPLHILISTITTHPLHTPSPKYSTSLYYYSVHPSHLSHPLSYISPPLPLPPLTHTEEEAARLRSECKALRSTATAAAKEAEEQRGLVAQALNDVEGSERSAAEAEASLAAARAAEASATRLLGTYEEQVRKY